MRPKEETTGSKDGESLNHPPVTMTQPEVDFNPEQTLPPSSVVFATAGYDHTIRFWDVLSGTTTGILQHAESVLAGSDY